jgi:hypothetical protein
MQLRYTPILFAALVLTGCPTPALTAPQTPNQELAVVAEGPCQKLAPARMGERTVIIFGETGYELSDWQAGEPWPAAQGLVELRDGDFGFGSKLLLGLPRDDRGYVPFDLRIGEDSKHTPWLRLTDTSYAQRGTGALLKRTYTDYSWNNGWEQRDEAIDLGGSATLKQLSPKEPCEDSKLAFLPLDHAIGSDGSVFVAGRCQDDKIVAYEDTTLVVAIAKPGQSQFAYARLPRSSRLSGMVNLDLEVRDANRAWLVAYEPFESPENRHSYFVEWDGQRFAEVDLEVDRGLMSIAHLGENKLVIAASDKLVEVAPNHHVKQLVLPAPLLAKSATTVHLHTASSTGNGELWVQGSYRVNAPQGPKGQIAPRDAAVLYSNIKTKGLLYCDAQEPAHSAVTVWESRP